MKPMFDLSQAASGHFLLRHKLQMPTVSFRVPTLADQRLQASTAPLTLIQAASGFGKTQLMANHAQQQPAAVWLSLDPKDNAPERLFLHLFAALQPLQKDQQNRAQLLQQRPEWDSDFVFWLLESSDLSAGVFYLDDLHLLQDPATLSLLYQWLSCCPIPVVVGTQQLPQSWPLETLSLNNKLTQIETHDLRFSTADLSQFFEHHQQPLDPEQAQGLQALSQGWPLGCLFLLKRLQQGAHVSELQDTQHTLSQVQNYLQAVVMPELSSPQLAFLQAAALLDDLTPELASVLAPDGPELLQALADSTPLLSKQTAGHYVVLPICRPPLIAQLTSEQRQQNSQKLIVYWLQHQHWQPALELAQNLAEPAQLAETLLEIAPLLIAQGQIPVLKNSLSALAVEQFQALPKLEVYLALALALIGHTETAQQHLNHLQALPAQAFNDQAIHLLHIEALIARRQGDSQRLLALSERMLAAQPESALLMASAWFNKSLATLQQADYAAAERHFAHAIDWNQQAHNTMTQYAARVCQARCLLYQGALELAQQTYLNILADAESVGLRQHSLCGTIEADLASIAYEHNQLEQMQTYIQSSIETAKLAYNTDLIYVYLSGLHLLINAKHLSAAESLVNQAYQSAQKQSRAMIPYLQEIKQLLLIQQGQATGFQLDSPQKQFLYHWNQQQWTAAREALPDWQSEIDAQGRALPRLQLQVYWLYLNTQAGQAQDAAWQDLLQEAAQMGAFRSALDAWPEQDLKPYEQALTQAAPSTRQAWEAVLGTPKLLLSERERELLTCLEQGLSNRLMADRLCVSENTIKTHLKNMFRKLDVSNRTAAVAQARTQGLL